LEGVCGTSLPLWALRGASEFVSNPGSRRRGNAADNGLASRQALAFSSHTHSSGLKFTPRRRRVANSILILRACLPLRHPQHNGTHCSLSHSLSHSHRSSCAHAARPHQHAARPPHPTRGAAAAPPPAPAAARCRTADSRMRCGGVPGLRPRQFPGERAERAVLIMCCHTPPEGGLRRSHAPAPRPPALLCWS